MSIFMLLLNGLFAFLFALGAHPYFNDNGWNPMSLIICSVFVLNFFQFVQFYNLGF